MDCIPGSPSVNWAGPMDPKSPGTAIQSDNPNTTAVVSRATHRTNSSRALGMIGSERTAAMSAGKNTIADSGQRAG